MGEIASNPQNTYEQREKWALMSRIGRMDTEIAELKRDQRMLITKGEELRLKHFSLKEKVDNMDLTKSHFAGYHKSSGMCYTDSPWEVQARVKMNDRIDRMLRENEAIMYSNHISHPVIDTCDDSGGHVFVGAVLGSFITLVCFGVFRFLF